MDERAYETLFTELDWYTFPDGTAVQAVWTTGESQGNDVRPPYWTLLLGEQDGAITQYEVDRDGSIIGLRDSAPPAKEIEIDPDITVVQPLSPDRPAVERWRTELTVDDVKPEQL